MQAGGTRIRFSRLVDVGVQEVMELLNDPNIARHMPLAGRFDEAATKQWIEGKDGQWERNGYGPWAVYANETFAGWCGFQKEGLDADFALVLKPRFWGLGRRIYVKALRKGFADFGYDSIVVTLPPTRRVSRVLQRLGFFPHGEVEHSGERFFRFRLSRQDWSRFPESSQSGDRLP